MKRDNIETYRLPFTLDELLDELRMSIWCSASQIALLGKLEFAEAMIAPEAEFGMSEQPQSWLSTIDLDAYDFTATLRDAYDFAFQVNDPSRFGGDEWGDVMAFADGSVRTSWSGDFAPLMRDGSKLRHVADMVQGRVSLMTGGALSIRHLALLANMTEPAVRSALSAEGIKTEGRPASLSAAVALAWLRGRRGFVPTADGRAVQHLADGDVILQTRPFPRVLASLGAGSGDVRRRIMTTAGIDEATLDSLLAGAPVEISVRHLLRLAGDLRLDAAAFVAAYARFIGDSAQGA